MPHNKEVIRSRYGKEVKMIINPKLNSVHIPISVLEVVADALKEIEMVALEDGVDPDSARNIIGDLNMARDALCLERGTQRHKKFAQSYRITALEEMLRKKLDLIKCGIAVNYSGNPYENDLYIEVKTLLGD